MIQAGDGIQTSTLPITNQPHCVDYELLMLITNLLKHPATLRDVAKVVAVLISLSGFHLILNTKLNIKHLLMVCQDLFAAMSRLFDNVLICTH